MVGQKMVPILQKNDGSYMLESIDIVDYIDNLEDTRFLPARHSPPSANN
nr:glutathione S-transferase N-terminal domain-containing protein [Sodalis-like endosymbiont of Proechinophthirus fluctus]